MNIQGYLKIPSISIRAFKVWQRNRDVFMKDIKLNFLPPLLEPMLYLIALGFGLGKFVESINGVPYVVFIAPALIAVSVMYASFFECSYGSYVRMYYQKIFDAIVATPLTIDDVIAGELLWGATRSMINASIMVPVIGIFGLIDLKYSLLIIPFAFFGGLLFAAIGMCFAAVTPNIMSINYPVLLFITPMFLFSGTFFPIDVLPLPVQYFATAFLPLTHIVNVIRSLAFGVIDSSLLFGIIWVLIVGSILIVISINLMKRRLVV